MGEVGVKSSCGAYIKVADVVHEVEQDLGKQLVRRSNRDAARLRWA